MAYDATGLTFDYPTIFHNFLTLGGVDLRTLNISPISPLYLPYISLTRWRGPA